MRLLKVFLFVRLLHFCTEQIFVVESRFICAQEMKRIGMRDRSCDSILIWFTHSISLLPLLTFSVEDAAARQGDCVLVSTKSNSSLNEMVVCLFWRVSNILLLMLESRRDIYTTRGQRN